MDKRSAERILREEAARADAGPLESAWVDEIERLSAAAEAGGRTHVAFVGTAILARATDQAVDVHAVKPSRGDENAYSARTLCHSVLVPVAAELGVSLGVTGREPLNNQPYFRILRVGDETPVHGAARATFEVVVRILGRLARASPDEARAALRAFIAVRRRYQPRYTGPSGVVEITPKRLMTATLKLLRDASENGRRAQAVVAGVMDAVAGPGRVESGRINDPSRKYPGDVCVRSAADRGVWEKALEVRDKVVAASDAFIFGKKCVDMGVREAGVVMVADRQPPLDAEALARWADNFGIGLTLFHGLDAFVDQALFWAPEPKPVAARQAAGYIHERLVAVEASPAAVILWQALTQSQPGSIP